MREIVLPVLSMTKAKDGIMSYSFNFNYFTCGSDFTRITKGGWNQLQNINF